MTIAMQKEKPGLDERLVRLLNERLPFDGPCWESVRTGVRTWELTLALDRGHVDSLSCLNWQNCVVTVMELNEVARVLWEPAAIVLRDAGMLPFAAESWPLTGRDLLTAKWVVQTLDLWDSEEFQEKADQVRIEDGDNYRLWYSLLLEERGGGVSAKFRVGVEDFWKTLDVVVFSSEWNWRRLARRVIDMLAPRGLA
jgi:hypothetical protein